MGRHGNRSHTLLPELQAVASATGRRAGAVEGPPGCLRPTAGTTRCGAEGLLDFLQASVLRYRQVTQTPTPEGPGQTPCRRTTRTPQTRTCLVPARIGQRGIARLRPGPLPPLRTGLASHHRRAARRPADRDP